MQTDKASWMVLPAPYLTSLQKKVDSNSDCDSSSSANNPKQLKRSAPSSVRFEEVHIRSYAQKVADNPCVSYGPPISLD